MHPFGKLENKFQMMFLMRNKGLLSDLYLWMMVKDLSPNLRPMLMDDGEGSFT